jgi:hypothetical protein
VTTALPASPASALPLIDHLSMWGEIATYEVHKLGGGAAEWLEVLGEAGVVEEIRSETGESIAWALTRSGEALLSAQPDGAARLALFRVPAYRSYLVGILAEGVALAAKADMHEQLDGWTGNELAALLPEINAVLDRVEEGRGRLVDVGRAEVEKRCSALPGRNTDFSTWDQVLLGRAGRPQDLFDFVLRRFAPWAVLPRPSAAGHLPAVLRHLPLNSGDGPALGQRLTPSCWNTRRRCVASSIPVFDEIGRFLGPPDAATYCLPNRAIQDALVQQPFYRATVNLAICAWRSPATMMPTVDLVLTPGSNFGDVRVLVGSHDIGLLRRCLPGLVGIDGMRILGLPEEGVPPDLTDNMLLNLLDHEILQRLETKILLHPDYQASLMADRLRTVFRPGKDSQRRMLEALIASRPDGGGGQS